MEPSSTISFASSSSNASPSQSQVVTDMEAVSLSKLSSNLERLLHANFFDCADAEINVDDGDASPINIHRCILAARSRFFYDLFSNTDQAGPTAGPSKRRYRLSQLVPHGRVGREALTVILAYLYTGRLSSAPPEVATCVDESCLHDACWPAIESVVELMYAAAAFQIQELVSLFLRRLLDFVDKALVEDIVPILLVAANSELSELLSLCIQRVAKSDLGNTFIEKKIPCNVCGEIKQLRLKSQPGESSNSVAESAEHEKRVTKIHKALDSHDVHLVKMLLTESRVTLDDACALHYAAAYCEPNIVAELLAQEAAMVKVNLKNDRGYTPLHVAAMRREPDIIVSLLSKGASVAETTPDGRNAASICRRLTREKDYNAKTEKCQETNKARMCIDVLEREMKRIPFIFEDSMAVEELITTPLLADTLHMKLLYLEDRVAFARIFFPAEAKLAMRIANADSTSEFAGLSATNAASRLKEVDLKQSTPSMQNQRLRQRLDALTKTVELGRRYFPHCSEVLDKFLEDDLSDPFLLETCKTEEQKIKRMRFLELKEDVRKAFTKDKAASIGKSPSSSSSSPKDDACQNNSLNAWIS